MYRQYQESKYFYDVVFVMFLHLFYLHNPMDVINYMKAKISVPSIPMPLMLHNISYFFLAETISIMGLRSSSCIPLTVWSKCSDG